MTRLRQRPKPKRPRHELNGSRWASVVHKITEALRNVMFLSASDWADGERTLLDCKHRVSRGCRGNTGSRFWTIDARSLFAVTSLFSFWRLHHQAFVFSKHCHDRSDGTVAGKRSNQWVRVLWCCDYDPPIAVNRQILHLGVYSFGPSRRVVEIQLFVFEALFKFCIDGYHYLVIFWWVR